MKKIFIICLMSLLLMGCGQPDVQGTDASLPVDEAEEVADASLTDAAPLSAQEKSIIPPEDQTVQVILTPEALDQIAQDLNDPNSRNKVLKIKPAID